MLSFQAYPFVVIVVPNQEHAWFRQHCKERTVPADLKHIEHIFVVMMENRSFDHLLGYLDLPPHNRTDITGIKDAQSRGYGNLHNGTKYAPQLRTVPTLDTDPLHERESITQQMQWQPGDPMMSGFVEDYATVSPNDPYPVGQYYTAAEVPVSNFLAENFCVCDHWFACLPASTQPNRLMAMSGYAMRDHTLNQQLEDQDNIVYDWLDQHGVSWRVYSEGPPFFMLMPKVRNRIIADIWSHHFRGFQMLVHDLTNSGEQLPQVIFIEPEYTDGPNPEKGDDDHPTTSITRGQKFLLDVYNAIAQSDPVAMDRWSKSVLVIMYDEHGGFFDHVEPRPLLTKQIHGENYKLFTTTGVRVPALVVSPFVEQGRAFNGVLDHTSILKLLAEKFGTPGEKYSEDVAARTSIQSLGAVLTRGSARPGPPPVPALALAASPGAPLPSGAMLSPNQLAFRNALEEVRQGDPKAGAQKFPQLKNYFMRGSR
jgi:phospholipase C